MKKQTVKKPIFSIWKYAVGICILLVTFGLGLAFDFNVSKSLYKNNNWYVTGMIVSTTIFALTSILVEIIGLILIYSSFIYKDKQKFKTVWGCILGLILIAGFSIFFGIEMKDFTRVNINSILLPILATLIPILLIAISYAIFWVFIRKRINESKYYYASMFFVFCVMAGALTYLILNPLWSRPRPYWVFSSFEWKWESRFKNWWDLQPFESLINAEKEIRHACRSFPSGHTLMSCCILGCSIYLYKLNIIKSKTTNNVLFWASILLIIIMGLNRVIGGNHHLSDVSFSAIIGVTYAFVARFIKFNKKITIYN